MVKRRRRNARRQWRRGAGLAAVLEREQLATSEIGSTVTAAACPIPRRSVSSIVRRPCFSLVRGH